MNTVPKFNLISILIKCRRTHISRSISFRLYRYSLFTGYAYQYNNGMSNYNVRSIMNDPSYKTI